MIKVKKLTFFVVFLLMFVLVASSLVFAAEPKILRIGLSGAEGTPEVTSAEKFGEILGQLSGGQLVGKVLAGGLAGGERDIVEGQQLGTLGMSVVCGILQNFDPAMMILEYEFLFRNEEHIDKVFNGPIGEKITKRLIDKAGIRSLAIFMRTPRLLTTNREISKLEDLKGLKIRVPEMPARVALWKALGASPTPLSFPEVFTALQTGTIDGQENPIGLIYSSKFYEVIDWLAITNHIYGFMILTISEPVYQSLSEQEKIWVNAAAELAKNYNDKLVKETEKEFMDKVTEKMKVTKPDTEPWREATKDVYKKFTNIEGFEELYLDIVEAGKNL